MSQEEFAARLQRFGWDVGRTTVTKIELGERCVTDFEMIAISNVLEIGVDALISGFSITTVKRMLNALHR